MPFTQDDVRELARWVPVALVLAAILYAGHAGYWYWGPGVRAMLKTLETDRDEWRRLALVLLKEKGIELNEGDAPPLLREGPPKRPPPI